MATFRKITKMHPSGLPYKASTSYKFIKAAHIVNHPLANFTSLPQACNVGELTEAPFDEPVALLPPVLCIAVTATVLVTMAPVASVVVTTDETGDVGAAMVCVTVEPTSLVVVKTTELVFVVCLSDSPDTTVRLKSQTETCLHNVI